MDLRIAIGLSLLVSFTAAAAPAAQRRPPLDYWVGRTTEAVQPGTVAFGASLRAEVKAARGEREAFFIVLPGAESGRPNIELIADGLTGHTGMIPPERFVAWRAAWVEAGGKRVADALLPLDRSPSEVKGAAPAKPGDDVVLYVELSVPADAAPGRYGGSVRVLAPSGEALIPVLLTVAKVSVPDRTAIAPASVVGDPAKVGIGTPGYMTRSLAWTAWVERSPKVGGSGASPLLRYELKGRAGAAADTADSVRLKLLEDGAEDQALLRAADEAGRGVLARVLALRMTRHPDLMDFEAIRAELFRAIGDAAQ